MPFSLTFMRNICICQKNVVSLQAIYAEGVLCESLGIRRKGEKYMATEYKYPISVQEFDKIRNGGYIYVDKTDLVYRLAQKNVCFLCRPRRFGKSLLISTLDAYFRGRKELFEGLKMAELETEWKEYPIFHVDFANGRYTESTDITKEFVTHELERFESLYGKSNASALGLRMAHVFEQAHIQTGRGVVVLVDEYDKPMLDTLNTPLEAEHREILKEFYSCFKSLDKDLRFVLLTGVTKFAQVSVFSGLNNLEDISMNDDFEAICGISEEELYTVFAEPIRQLAKEYQCDENEMKLLLKNQYDGYHFSRRQKDMYNPFSLINVFSRMAMDDYWFRSGTPTYLMKLLGGHNVNVQNLLSRDYSPEYFMDYRANVEDPLAMLYQAGYLTIKGFDRRYNMYTLDFPNSEVRNGLVTLLANDYLHSTNDIKPFVTQIGRMLRDCRLEDMRDAMKAFLSSIPYEANKDMRALDFETHYQYTFYLLFRVLSCYETLIEKQNSHGRADIVVEVPDYVYIFEFKLDGSADEALAQIETKGYAEPYLADARSLYKIGVNITTETRTITEWKVIEKKKI